MKTLRRLLSKHWRKLVCFAAFLALWQFVVVQFGIKSFILPAPTRVFAHIFVPSIARKFNWPTHIFATFLEIFLSFIATAVVGVGLAVAMTWSSILNKLVTPIIVFFNSLPKIALAPLFLIWFGFGILPNVLIAILCAFFPVVINTVTGLNEVDEDLLDLVRYLNAGKLHIFTKIRIPNSLPFIFSGFKISATMCVVGAIVGEFIASDKGLGFLLKEAQAFIDTPTMFACLFLISALGMLFFSAISMLENVAMPWRNRRVEVGH